MKKVLFAILAASAGVVLGADEICGAPRGERAPYQAARPINVFNLFTYFEAPYHVTDTTPWDFIVTHGLTPESIKGRPASIPANWWYEP